MQQRPERRTILYVPNHERATEADKKVKSAPRSMCRAAAAAYSTASSPENVLRDLKEFSIGHSVPALVPREALARANGRLELARSAAFAAGLALGGALVTWAGAPAAFVLAAVLSVSAVVLLLRLVEPPRAPVARRHPLIDIREGAHWVWRHALLRPILLTAVAWNISWFVLQSAYVSYAIRLLGLDAAAVGMTLAAYGAGMVMGALLAPHVAAKLPFGRAIQLGPAVSVLAALTMAATLVLPSGVLAGMALFSVRSRPDCLDHHVGPQPCGKPSPPAPCWGVCRRFFWLPIQGPDPSAPHWVVSWARPGANPPA